ETKAYSGIIVISYGTDAVTGPNGGDPQCPKLGEEPVGGFIPDDVKPGDVLDLAGKTAYYLPSGAKGCGTKEGDSSVPTYQILANQKDCPAVKTGTAPVPKAHTLSAADVAKLSSSTDKDTHDMWS